MRGIGWILGAALFVAGCGGGGGGGGGTSSVPAVTATSAGVPTASPTAVATLPSTSQTVVTAGTSGTQNVTFGSVGAGFGGSLVLPATTSGTGQVTATLSASAPVTAPVLASSKRLPRAVGGGPTGLEFVQISANAPLTFGMTPQFTFTLPAGETLALGTQVYIALFDPTQGGSGWIVFVGPGVVNGTTITFASVPTTVQFAPNVVYVFACFSTSQPVATPTPVPTASPSPSPTATYAASPSPSPSASASPSPSPSPSATATSQAGFACPSTDGTLAIARSSGSSAEAVHRAARHAGNAGAAQGLLAVTYDRMTARMTETAIQTHEIALGARLVHSYDFPHTNLVTRVIAVPPARAASIAAALRAQSGVRSVAATGAPRYASSVSQFPQGYFPSPNDPYFFGFTGGAYREAASVPGQWDMHAIGLEYAYAYSQANNGSGIVNANALGSSAVKIAVIDTGEDSLHPDLAGKVVGQHCFITDPNFVQSTSGFSTDPDGHGTDVSGIAAASLGNGFGFTGAGGNVSLYGYRVFPTPDSSCLTNSPDGRCGAGSTDITDAIQDAIAQHVNVISMSLGSSQTCTNGQDPDPVEGQAIAEAIAANVVVVVASGNEGTATIDSPACVTGVIAVGATSLDDGQPNGTGHSGGSTGSPIEYVAGYSNYLGTQGQNLHSASAWGIVAPGGDPGSADLNPNLPTDDLHWIENIWTQTPFTSADAGNCASDFQSVGAGDCRTLIAGTSMATPHVAGAAALILSVAPSYAQPGAMKALLCSTADGISDAHQGCGRLNIYRAMATALGDQHLP